MNSEQATQLINPLSTYLIDLVSKALKSKLAKKSITPIEQYRGLDVYHLGDLGIGYYVLTNEEHEVVYFVRYRKVRANGLAFGRQVLVWRDKNELGSEGFASEVFFNKLLPTFKALISDTQQSPNGRQFWGFSLLHAFKTGKYVYCLDRRSSPNQLTWIQGDADLKSMSPVIWGTDEGHLRTHVVISSVPLSLKAKAA